MRLMIGTLLMSAMAVTVPTRRAEACSCLRPTAFPLLSQNNDLAINVRLPIAVEHYSPATFELRDSKGKVVGVTTVEAGTKTSSILVLKPIASLEPTSEYSLVRVGKKRESTLKIFHTGKNVDRLSPRWKGVTKAVLIDPSAARSTKNKDGSTFISFSSCDIGSPHITITLSKPAKDNRTKASDILYALWFIPPSEKFDPNNPVSAFIPAPTSDSGKLLGTLVIGRESICDPHLIEKMPIKGSSIAVAAVDASGNMSKAFVIEVM